MYPMKVHLFEVKKEKKKYHSHSVVMDVFEEVVYIFIIGPIVCCTEPSSSVLTGQLLTTCYLSLIELILCMNLLPIKAI